jgi:hypothetical protein
LLFPHDSQRGQISNNLSQIRFPNKVWHSDVSIAKLIAQRAHRILDRNLRRKHAQIKEVIKSGIRGVGVEEGGCADHGVLAGLQVLVLPDPPGAVDLCVV